MVNRDRGQLILVGAIAIALILLGLVLIVNTALFTQVVGSEGTVESAKEGSVSGQEIGDSIGALVAEENRNGPTSVTPPVDDLEDALARRSLESSGSFVSLDSVSERESGRFFAQMSDGPLTDTAGNDNWSPVTGGDVGEFLVTLDTSDSASETFDITANSSDATPRTLSVTVVGPDEIALSGADASGCSAVRVTDDSVTIDVRHGVVYGDNSCQFELFTGTNPPYEVTFDNGDNMDATYSIATSQTSSFDPSQPTGHEIVWSFEYGFTYESTDATVESDSRVIDVYD